MNLPKTVVSESGDEEELLTGQAKGSKNNQNNQLSLNAPAFLDLNEHFLYPFYVDPDTAPNSVEKENNIYFPGIENSVYLSTEKISIPMQFWHDKHCF